MVEKESTQTEPVVKTAQPLNWLSIISWGVAALMVALLIFVFIRRIPTVSAIFNGPAEYTQVVAAQPATVELPAFNPNPVATEAVNMNVLPNTIIPSDRPREKVEHYKVAEGDSIFGISKDYNLKPESVLWANYDLLGDDPSTISVGQMLNIPPVDGVYYKWQQGDTLEKVAEKYHANVEDIIAFPGNHLDMANPQVQTGWYIMIPGGKGEVKTWTVPIFFRPNSGANRNINSQCSTFQNGPGGTGSFIWPTTGTHTISGNDFWSGHLGLDISALLGDQILATDSGWIVYAGSIAGGYGNMVMIDHGNGYYSLYGHLSQVLVTCGQYVNQGHVIGLAGSTGNSTGPHLHFELRYYDSFLNPWQYLQ